MTGEISPVGDGYAYFELHHHMHRMVERSMSCAGLSFARTRVLMRLDEIQLEFDVSAIQAKANA